MILFILKVTACLGAFLVFYKLFLETLNIHRFKRFYLLGILVLSFVIPNITFIEYVDTTTEVSTENTPLISESLLSSEQGLVYMDILTDTLWIAYFFGVAFALFRFCFNLSQMILKIKQNPNHRSGSFVNVLIRNLNIPHTFLNYIFLNKSKFEHNTIPKEVVLHEQAHAAQKHTIDILFLEILQIVFWFNPLLYILKKQIKLNHEFLADQAVLDQGYQLSAYQSTILAFSSKASQNQLAHAINYSSIKKRFTVMKTTTRKSKIWLHLLLLVPITGLLMSTFSSTKIVEKDSEQLTSITMNNLEIIQEGATKAQIEAYNRLAKKYNGMLEEDREIKLEDLKTLKRIYSLMTKEQKAKALPFPKHIPPPPPKPQVIKIKEVPAPPPPPKPGKADSKELPPPPPPPAPEIIEVVEVPSPPPPPKPLEYVMAMAEENAVFYYEGKRVSSKEAVNMVRKYQSMHIKTKKSDSRTPEVYLSKTPMIKQIKKN